MPLSLFFFFLITLCYGFGHFIRVTKIPPDLVDLEFNYMIKLKPLDFFFSFLDKRHLWSNKQNFFFFFSLFMTLSNSLNETMSSNPPL